MLYQRINLRCCRCFVVLRNLKFGSSSASVSKPRYGTARARALQFRPAIPFALRRRRPIKVFARRFSIAGEMRKNGGMKGELQYCITQSAKSKDTARVRIMRVRGSREKRMGAPHSLPKGGRPINLAARILQNMVGRK